MKTWNEKNFLFLIGLCPDALVAQDEDGFTPLHRACSMEGLTCQTFSGMLGFASARGALCITSRSGRLPLHCMCLNRALDADGQGSELLEMMLAHTPHELALSYTTSGYTSLHLLLCNTSVRVQLVQTLLRCSDRTLCTLPTKPHGLLPLEMARMHRLPKSIVAELYVAFPAAAASKRLGNQQLAPFLFNDGYFTEEVVRQCPYVICAHSTPQKAEAEPEELAEIMNFYTGLTSSSNLKDILDYIAPHCLTCTNSVVGLSQEKARSIFLQHKCSKEIRDAIEASKCLIRFQQYLMSDWSCSYRDYQGRTVLMLAAMNDETSLIDELVAAGANLEEVDNFGRSALCCSLLNTSHFSNRGAQWPEPFRSVRAAKALLHYGAKVSSLQRTPAAVELVKAVVGNHYNLLQKETDAQRKNLVDAERKSETKDSELDVRGKNGKAIPGAGKGMDFDSVSGDVKAEAKESNSDLHNDSEDISVENKLSNDNGASSIIEWNEHRDETGLLSLFWSSRMITNKTSMLHLGITQTGDEIMSEKREDIPIEKKVCLDRTWPNFVCLPQSIVIVSIFAAGCSSKPILSSGS
jgi:hypothetical protein